MKRYGFIFLMLMTAIAATGRAETPRQQLLAAIGPKRLAQVEAIVGKEVIDRNGDVIAEEFRKLDLEKRANEWLDGDKQARRLIQERLDDFRVAFVNHPRVKAAIGKKQDRVDVIEAIASREAVSTRAEEIRGERADARLAKQKADEEAEEQRRTKAAQKKKEDEAAQKKRDDVAAQKKKDDAEAQKRKDEADRQAREQRKARDEAAAVNRRAQEQGRRASVVGGIADSHGVEAYGSLVESQRQRDLIAHPPAKPKFSEQTKALFDSAISFDFPMEWSGLNGDQRIQAGIGGAGAIELFNILVGKRVMKGRGKLARGSYQTLRIAGDLLAAYSLVSGIQSNRKDAHESEMIRQALASEKGQRLIAAVGKSEATTIIRAMIKKKQNLSDIIMTNAPAEETAAIQKILEEQEQEVAKVITKDFIQDDAARTERVRQIARLRAKIIVDAQGQSDDDEAVVKPVLDRMMVTLREEVRKTLENWNNETATMKGVGSSGAHR